MYACLFDQITYAATVHKPSRSIYTQQHKLRTAYSTNEMGRNLLAFCFNLFGIDHTITHGSVAFLSFTISWNLFRRYEIKVITSTPKRSTITSNGKKK